MYNKRGNARLSTCSVLASTRVTQPAPRRDLRRFISQSKPVTKIGIILGKLCIKHFIN